MLIKLNIQFDSSHCKHLNSSSIESLAGRLYKDKDFLKMHGWWWWLVTWVVSFFQIPLESIKNLEIFNVWSSSQWCFSIKQSWRAKYILYYTHHHSIPQHPAFAVFTIFLQSWNNFEVCSLLKYGVIEAFIKLTWRETDKKENLFLFPTKRIEYIH